MFGSRNADRLRQGCGEGLTIGIAMHRRLREHSRQYLVGGRVQFGNRWHRMLGNAEEEIGEIVVFKRLCARKKFIGDHAEGILIGRASDLAARNLLGAHIARRAQQCTGLRTIPMEQAGDTKIRDFNLSPAQHQVARFDVAMHNAAHVGIVESLGRLIEDRQQIGGRHAARKAVEGGTVHIFHEDIGVAGIFGDVVDGDDIRMRENACGLSFAQQVVPEYGTALLVA